VQLIIFFTQHMLLTSDPELRQVQTQCGTVEFVQIVPITSEELVSVQQWNGTSFLQLMRRVPQ
jgi:suppressor of fused-like protein